MAGKSQPPERQDPAEPHSASRFGFNLGRLRSDSGAQNGPTIEPKSIPTAIMLQMQKSLKNLVFFNVFGPPRGAEIHYKSKETDKKQGVKSQTDKSPKRNEKNNLWTPKPDPPRRQIRPEGQNPAAPISARHGLVY